MERGVFLAIINGVKFSTSLQYHSLARVSLLPHYKLIFGASKCVTRSFSCSPLRVQERSENVLCVLPCQNAADAVYKGKY